MLAEAIAGALDLDHDGMVQQAVEQCGGDDGIAEHLAPFGKAAVGGEDHAAALVAGVDQLKEQVATARDDREIADLIDQQDGKAAVEPDALLQLALALGLGEGGDDVGQGGEIDAVACLDRLNAEGDGEVRLAGAGRAEEMHGFAAADEVELGQGEDTVAVERGLEGEVEPRQGLRRGQPGDLQGSPDAAPLAQRQFLGEQGIDCFQRADAALLQLTHGILQDLERTRHAQADQVAADLLEGAAGRRGKVLHGVPPSVASRWATAA